MRRGVVVVALVSALSLASDADPAAAQDVEFGAEALFGSETDFGLGLRILTALGASSPVDFQGGFNLFFPDGRRDYWEINGNVWYRFETAGQGAPYAGAGLNIGHLGAGPDASSDTQLGLNLGGGYRFNFTNTSPFVEARFTVAGHEQFVFGGGVLFRGF